MNNKPSEHFRMVDVGAKPTTYRRALAQGTIEVGKDAFALIRRGEIPKGDVLALAEAAGILGAKRTADVIPLCHPLGLDQVKVSFKLTEEDSSVTVFCEARATAKTGVEMEALSGVTAALLSVYDLTKGVQPALTISDIRLRIKEGGKSGRWVHPDLQDVVEKTEKAAPRELPLKGISSAVITISDSTAEGKREDTSGPIIIDFLKSRGAEVVNHVTVGDEKSEIVSLLKHFSSTSAVSLVLTTGGTGLGPRDVTPEAIEQVSHKLIPGIGEHILRRGINFTPRAVLSRAIAGLVDRTLVIALPGSPRGVAESLAALAEVLPHALSMVGGGGHE